jgi:MFS family permease
MADWWGRKIPIAVGGCFMIVGALLGAFANGYGSKFNDGSKQHVS